MAVKDLEGLDEAARGLSSPETVEATKRALSAVAKDELKEALYARLLGWFATSVGEVDREELVRAASAPSNAELLFWLFEQAALRDTMEEGPLVRARLRGVQARRELLGAEGGTVSSGQAAELLGITPQAVDKRRRAGKLLALPVGRAYLYPVWQFDERGGVLAGLEEVLGSFGVEDAWMRASYFLRENGRLDDERPLDVLREGDIEGVERAARAYGEHGAE
ncbi:MAG: hypothetical protein H0U55_07345 [Rubrobacteraceae bacterium]|nr:hypothetical protein [Rubrobacteraceae bacterium]